MATVSSPAILNVHTQPTRLSTTCYSGHFSARKATHTTQEHEGTHVDTQVKKASLGKEKECNSIPNAQSFQAASAEVSA